MRTINGPITFKKDQPLNKEVLDSLGHITLPFSSEQEIKVTKGHEIEFKDREGKTLKITEE